MQIRFGYRIDLVCDQATPLIAMLDVHPERRPNLIVPDRLSVRALATGENVSTFSSYRDTFGNICRRTMVPAGGATFQASGTIHDSGRREAVPPDTPCAPPERLPPDTLVYLLGSRYCETDLLMQEAWSMFGPIRGGRSRVQAICDFVHGHIRFDYDSARSTRTAFQAYEEGVGVCRDYAHLALTLCRCLNIPARYCTGYLGDIGVPPNPAPGDFSGWFEVYLDGAWWTFDARHNEPRIGRILIARGRDATDVPILNTFGAHSLTRFDVVTEEIAAASARPRRTETAPQVYA